MGRGCSLLLVWARTQHNGQSNGARFSGAQERCYKCLCTHILNRHRRCKHFLTHRFQTNIDLLRASRARCVERPPQSRWNGILSFKAGSKQQRSRAPEGEDPWKRLGAKYEELLSDPGYIHDLLHDQGADFIEEQRAEFRRIIFLVPRVHLN